MYAVQNNDNIVQKNREYDRENLNLEILKCLYIINILKPILFTKAICISPVHKRSVLIPVFLSNTYFCRRLIQELLSSISHTTS